MYDFSESNLRWFATVGDKIIAQRRDSPNVRTWVTVCSALLLSGISGGGGGGGSSGCMAFSIPSRSSTMHLSALSSFLLDVSLCVTLCHFPTKLARSTETHLAVTRYTVRPSTSRNVSHVPSLTRQCACMHVYTGVCVCVCVNVCTYVRCKNDSAQGARIRACRRCSWCG